VNSTLLKQTVTPINGLNCQIKKMTMHTTHNTDRVSEKKAEQGKINSIFPTRLLAFFSFQ